MGEVREPLGQSRRGGSIAESGVGAHRHAGHRLDPTADPELDLPGEDAAGDVGDRREAAPAQPVHRLSRDGDGKAGGEHGAARDVEGLLADLGDAAEHHVLDLPGGHARALERRVQDVRCEVDGVDSGQAPLPLAAGSPDRIDDECLCHAPRTRRD